MVVAALVAVRIQRQAFRPGWERGHEMASTGDGEARMQRFIDDDFIMNMHHNPMPSIDDCVHASDEQITSDRLNYVLGKFPTVGF